MKSKYSLNYLVGKYREIVQSKKTAGVLVISEEKPKQSEMHGTHENQMNSLSEQGNLLWGTDNFSGVAVFQVQVC